MFLKRIFIPILLLLIPLFFFYKTVLFQQVPFPGDLLLGNSEPYKSDTDLGFALGSVPNKGQGSDVIRQLYPWKYFSVESMKQGMFPLWNPYTLAGTPHFANLQSAALYPVNVLFFILPFVDGWSVYIILQYIFLLVFTYLYLREINLKKIPSLFGAVSFTFCAFTAVWGEYGNLGHSLAFLPLALFSIEKIFKEKKWYWYVLLTASYTLSILAGYIQLTMYLYILSFAYAIARNFSLKKRERNVLISLFLSMGAGILVSAVQILPLYEFLQHSLRGTYSYKELSERLLPWQSSITLLAADFFGNPATRNYFLQGGSILERASNIGVWPFVFAVFAVFSKRTFFKTFFLVSTIVVYLSCLSLPPIAFIHSIGVPFLSTGIPTRALSLFSFCAAVLGAIGLNAFLLNKEKRKVIITGFVFLLLFICLWVYTFVVKDPMLAVSRHNLILPTGILILGFVLIMVQVQRKIVAVVILGLTLIELFYGFQKFNSFIPKSYVYPETHITQELKKIQGISRYWGYGNANIDASFQLVDKNYTTDGYDALVNTRYGELLSASQNGKLPLEVPHTVANIFKGYGVNDLKQNPYRLRALDLTGVKFVLNKSENLGIDSAFDEKTFQLLWQRNGWQVYENKNVLPRVSLFGTYLVEKDPKKIVQKLYDVNFDIHKVVILEDSPGKSYNIQPDPTSTVTIISYKPNSIKLVTASKTDQLLFVSDNFFPGWKVTVDGTRADILRADYTFRAVVLKKGTHEVVFTYSPQSFWIGFWISLGTFTCLIFVCAFASITKRRG